MVTEYPVKACIELRPVGSPWVRVTAPGHDQQFQLTELRKIDLLFSATESAEVCVHQFNKAELDPYTAVEIVSVSFFDITHPKFAWAGVYWPSYPKHLHGEPQLLPGQTYLSWNGRWSLQFSVPVFSWMHRVLDLGWIYD